jgi:hypothetical protein
VLRPAGLFHTYHLNRLFVVLSPAYPPAHALRRYKESITSFAALARQTASLSQSSSTLFDDDHPSMRSKTSSYNLNFKPLSDDKLDALRKQLGLKEWEKSSE